MVLLRRSHIGIVTKNFEPNHQVKHNLSNSPKLMFLGTMIVSEVGYGRDDGDHVGGG
jgi:hypothetical protein